MPNANILFLQKVKKNESNREESNAYFDTSPTMVPKSDKPRYCNKNDATPKATSFNYQPGVHTKLRGIDIVCATYNVLSLTALLVISCFKCQISVRPKANFLST